MSLVSEALGKTASFDWSSTPQGVVNLVKKPSKKLKKKNMSNLLASLKLDPKSGRKSLLSPA